MKRAWKPLATLLLLAGAGALLVAAFIAGRAEFAMEQERERPVQAPSRVVTTGGESIVTLNPGELAHAGIVVASAKTIVYPNARYVPGTIVDTAELLSMQRQFQAARDRLPAKPANPATLASLAAGARRRWGDVIARWLVEEAPPWQRLLQGRDQLVRVVLKVGASLPPHAWIDTPGQTTALAFVSPLPVRREEEGTPFLYIVPGAAIRTRGTETISVALAAGPAARGVTLPASAIVWWEGKSWAYMQQAPGRFVRRAVAVRPAAGNELIAAGFAADAPVVVVGAQLLLSEEQRGQIHVGEEGQ